MNQISLWTSLKLDSLEDEIPFRISKVELIKIFERNSVSFDVPDERIIIVKSSLLSLEELFYVSFQFEGEKMIAITMSPCIAVEGKELNSRYKKIQTILENELGRPYNRWRLIMNFLDPDNRLSYWMRDGRKIEHYLQDRFAMEEIINIKL